MKYHHVREYITAGVFQVVKVISKEMIADFLTNPLKSAVIRRAMEDVNIVEFMEGEIIDETEKELWMHIPRWRGGVLDEMTTYVEVQFEIWDTFLISEMRLFENWDMRYRDIFIRVRGDDTGAKARKGAIVSLHCNHYKL